MTWGCPPQNAQWENLEGQGWKKSWKSKTHLSVERFLIFSLRSTFKRYLNWMWSPMSCFFLFFWIYRSILLLGSVLVPNDCIAFLVMLLILSWPGLIQMWTKKEDSTKTPTCRPSWSVICFYKWSTSGQGCRWGAQIREKTNGSFGEPNPLSWLH